MSTEPSVATDTSPTPAPSVATTTPKAAGGGPLTAITHVILIAWALATAIPILWVLGSSVKTDNEIFIQSYRLPEWPWKFENYARAWSVSNFSQYFLNSLIVVGCSVIIVMLLGSMVSYCLARYDFRGRKPLTVLFIAANAVPILVAMVPLYGVMKEGIVIGGFRWPGVFRIPVLAKIPLIGTYHGLILVYVAFALPFTVFFLMAFFKSLPKEIFEAAFVDGAGHFRTFFLVMLPMARPGLISIGIFNALGLWNQYVIPLFINNDNPQMYVVPQGLAKMAAEAGYASDFSGLFAGLVIGMAPVLILYLIFQKQIQQGMTAGALK